MKTFKMLVYWSNKLILIAPFLRIKIRVCIHYNDNILTGSTSFYSTIKHNFPINGLVRSKIENIGTFEVTIMSILYNIGIVNYSIKIILIQNSVT